MGNTRESDRELNRIYDARCTELCARLEKARCEAGLSQKTVAREIGRSQTFMSRIRSGNLKIGVSELVQLSALYRKPLRYFFDGWCTVSWSEGDDLRPYSPEPARKWELEAKTPRKRKRRTRYVKKLFATQGRLP